MFTVSSSAILLRKISGVLTACRRTTVAMRGATGGFAIPTLLGVVALFLSAILRPLAVLALCALVLHGAHVHGFSALAGVGVIGQMESNAIVEKRQEFQAKQKEVADVFDLAKDGSTYDFTRKSVLEKLGAKDESEALEKIRAKNRELNDLGETLRVAELKAMEQANRDRGEELLRPATSTGLIHPVADNGRMKSFGDLAVESKKYVDVLKRGAIKDGGVTVEVDIGLKTLFQTTAGFAPESTRSGLMVEAVSRPIQILDLIPTRPIGQALDKYMEETTRTPGAAEKAEGTTYAESVFVWTERSNPVQKITDSIPVTDEQLEDAPEVGAILDQRLRFGLRQRLDQQVVIGNGTPPNLRGVLNVSGIQTQAKGADPVFDAVFKAMTLVRVTGRANPTALLIHPTDWQGVRLLRTAAGEYIMGNPALVGATTLFGLPVAITDVLTAGTAVLGDFANFSYIGERRGIDVAIGYTGTQFTEGKKTIRADLRAVFTVTRPAAFATVTGL